MPGIEVGLVTTNLEAMMAFYEGFPRTRAAGRDRVRRRFPAALLARQQRAQARHLHHRLRARGAGRRPCAGGLRYFTIGVNKLRGVAEAFEASAYEVVEPLTEFAPVPGMGWMFVADPDGNWIELFGTL